MGIFDINIVREFKQDKEQLINNLKEKLSPLSNESEHEKNTLLFKNFKAKGTLLTYDVSVDIEKSKNDISLNIDGELLNVWILVILIVLGILFTYGLGLILIVGFAYYQKIVATKYINKILDEITS